MAAAPLGARIRRGSSLAREPAAAVAELKQQIFEPGLGLVIVFCSPIHDLEAIAAELDAQFPGVHVVGCTTAGEINATGYVEGSLTGIGFAGGYCRAASRLIPDLSGFQMSDGVRAAEAAAAELAAGRPSPETGNSFALLLIDGMSGNEEIVLAALHAHLGGIPLFGGSAGDGLQLRRGHVYWRGRFHADAALVTLIDIDGPVRLYTTQHFEGTRTRMVVTRADPGQRLVHEINAEPAAAEYARIVGVAPDRLTPTMFAEHPVMVKIGGDYYVRAIQRANPDGSLAFFCAVDRGIVLTLAARNDILDHLRQFFERVRRELGEPVLVLGFDCILRNLASRILADNNVIGFSTYGEQFSTMHVNHTFTAAVFGESAGP